MNCIFCEAEAMMEPRPDEVKGYWVDWWCNACHAVCIRNESSTSYENGKTQGKTLPAGCLFVMKEEPA